MERKTQKGNWLTQVYLKNGHQNDVHVLNKSTIYIKCNMIMKTDKIRHNCLLFISSFAAGQMPSQTTLLLFYFSY